MNQSIRVLLVDDHLIILDAYKNALNLIDQQDNNLNIQIDYARSGDSALSKFENCLKDNPYDFVFLDVRLPSKTSKITSGEQLAIIFKNLDPNVKLVIITGHYDVFVFHDILQNIDPDGLLFKSDAGMKIISDAFYTILNNTPYYSDTILRLLRKHFSSHINLNDTDKMLLFELAKGTKTKDLNKVVPLSQAGVERRKRYLKEVFKTQNQNDKALIKSAEKRGFL